MTTPTTRQDVYDFMRMRTSTRRKIASQFGLDMRQDKNESDFECCKGWLLEAKALGRLDELLTTVRESTP